MNINSSLYLFFLIFLVTRAPLTSSGDPTLQPLKSTLITHLLIDYNPNICPRLERSTPLYVHLTNRTLTMDFDEEHRKLTIILTSLKRWTDDRLKWQPERYGGIKTINDDDGLSPNAIYTPSLYTHSGNNYPCMEFQLSYTGEIVCNSKLYLSSVCKISGNQFPVDSYACTVLFSSWTEMALTCDGRNLTHCFELNATHTSAKFQFSTRRVDYGIAQWSMGENYTSFVCRILVKRLIQRRNVFMPPLIILGVAVLAQWLLLFNIPERFFLGTVLMVTCLTVLAGFHDLPEFEFGSGQKLLRVATAVLILNGIAMIVSALSANLLFNISTSCLSCCDMIQWLTRLRLSFLLPTKLRSALLESHEWYQLSVVIDRLLFVLTTIIFITIISVP